MSISKAFWAAAVLAVMTSPTLAQDALTGDNKMTLYTFDKDSGAESACYDDCAVNWPPYLVKDGESKGDEWAKVARKDGSMQWAYEGHPLYYYIEDKAAGDMKGEGKGGVWHVAK